MAVDLKWDLQKTLVDREAQRGSWIQHPELEYTAWVDADECTKGAYKATLVNGERGHRKVTAAIVYWRHLLYNTNVCRTFLLKIMCRWHSRHWDPLNKTHCDKRL